jgi:hypothetical protein
MDLQYSHLHERGQAARILDHQLGLLIARKFHRLDEGGERLRAMALEETWFALAGRAPHEADGPPL